MRLFVPIEIIDIIALAFLIIGTVILFLSTIKLNKDLVFGLSSSETHSITDKWYLFDKPASILFRIFIHPFLILSFQSSLFKYSGIHRCMDHSPFYNDQGRAVPQFSVWR